MGKRKRVFPLPRRRLHLRLARHCFSKWRTSRAQENIPKRRKGAGISAQLIRTCFQSQRLQERTSHSSQLRTKRFTVMPVMLDGTEEPGNLCPKLNGPMQQRLDMFLCNLFQAFCLKSFCHPLPEIPIVAPVLGSRLGGELCRRSSSR